MVSSVVFFSSNHVKPITNYGLCQFGDTNTFENPNAVTGESAIVHGVRWLRKTTQVPAQQGVSFGIEYVIHSQADELLQLEEVIRFPSAGLTNPATGKNQQQESFPTQIIAGEPSLTCYTFDYPWEIVTGTWTFQVYSEGQQILEKSFRIE